MKKMKTEQKVIEVVGGIIRRGDKYLLGPVDTVMESVSI